MEGDKVQDAIVESLIESDEYYQSLETPLKSADLIKAEHLAFLKEAVKMEVFKTEFNNAVDLLILEMLGFVGERRWKEILAEFSQCIKQNIYQFSEKTLEQIYQLGRVFIDRGRFSEAYSIFLFLAYLKPEIPEYWIGMGISLFSLRKFEDAIIYLKPASILQQDKATALIYLTHCYLQLKEYATAKGFLEATEKILSNSVEEKAKWGVDFDQLQQKVIKGG